MRKKIETFLIIILIGSLVFSIFYFLGEKKIAENKADDNSPSTMVKVARMLLSGEKTFLVLFQNDMELRPGGGFIGSFGIIRTEGGKVKTYEIHDTSNFDGRIPKNEDIPAPMEKIFRIKSWGLRDSNYSPDYPTNAEKALDFYYQGKGAEQFDGVLAINAVILERVLSVTGPIKLEGYPATFESGSALIALEKQVEIDFEKQGIARGDRKNVMNDFLAEVLKKADALSKLEKIKLANTLIKELENKNLQVYFISNDEGAKMINELGWDGKMDSAWDGDYFMTVDTNLGAYKSDYFIRRSLKYSVDLTTEIPQATLKITYNHTGKTLDWMTKDYLSYTRVYVPQGSRVTKFSDNTDVQYGEEFNKKLAGSFIKVPLNSSKTVEIKYDLPKEFKTKEYKLKIQKQSGSGDVPTIVDVKLANGETKHFELTLNKDMVVVK